MGRIKLVVVCTHLFVVICISVLTSYAKNESGEAFVIESNSQVHKEVMPLAVMWKEAILKKQHEDIVKCVLPENHEYVKEKLSDKHSKLYTALYGKKQSVYEFLKKTKRLKILIVGKEPISVFGVSIYYIDELNQKLSFPLSPKDQQNYWMKDYVVIGFIKINGDWKCSFEQQFEE